MPSSTSFLEWRTSQIQQGLPCGGHYEQAELVWHAAFTAGWEQAREQAADLVETEALPDPHSPMERWYKIQVELVSRAIRTMPPPPGARG